MMSEVSSLDLSTTIANTECVNIGATVFSATHDQRAPNNGFSYFYPKHTLRKAPLTVSVKSAAPITNGVSVGNRFSFTPYENVDHTDVDNSLLSSDVSATNQSTDLTIERAQLGTTEQLCVGGNTYFNKCSKISVKNCDGPIYIRNFFVDATLSGTNAIEVTNSDVVLENCAGIRAQEAGFKFNNSKVVLSRSAAAYRNYKIGSTSQLEFPDRVWIPCY